MTLCTVAFSSSTADREAFSVIELFSGESTTVSRRASQEDGNLTSILSHSHGFAA